jgi:hypothetical protein
LRTISAAFGGVREVSDEHCLGRRALLRRYATGQAMDRARADLDRIIETARERFLPFALAPRQCGKSAVALAAERCVDAELRQALSNKLGPHRRGSVLVGMEQFDSAKAGSGRSAEALQKRPFGKQQAEIGSKAGHAHSSFRVSRRPSTVGVSPPGRSRALP